MEPAILFKRLDPVQRALATRRRLPSIDLPRPESLSGVPGVLPHETAALRQWGRETAGLPVVWDVWRRRIAAFLPTRMPPEGREPDEWADVNDRSVGIARNRAAPTLVLLHGVLVSLDRFCQECTGAREFRDHAIIPAALIEVWQCLLQDPEPVRPAVGYRLADVHGRAPDAARRWVSGHQLLATLTQGQIVSLLAFERLQPAPGVEQTRAFLQRTTRLCQAGAAACRFTADLAHQERQARPQATDSGALPLQEAGQRGMDHRHLIEVVTRMRTTLAHARRVCPEEHAAMTRAIASYCAERHQLLSRRSTRPATWSDTPIRPVDRQPNEAAPHRARPEPVRVEPVGAATRSWGNVAAGPNARTPSPTAPSGAWTSLFTRLAGAHRTMQS